MFTKFCMKFFLIMKGVTMSFFLKIRRGKWRGSLCTFLNFSELWLMYCSTCSTHKFYKIWLMINCTAHRMSRYKTDIVTYVFVTSQNPHFFPPQELPAQKISKCTVLAEVYLIIAYHVFCTVDGVLRFSHIYSVNKDSPPQPARQSKWPKIENFLLRNNRTALHYKPELSENCI